MKKRQGEDWGAILRLLPKDFLKMERVFTDNENLIAVRIVTEETKALGRELWYVGEGVKKRLFLSTT